MDKMEVAVAVIMLQGKLLLLKRSPHKKYYPNKWENPGGRIEHGEQPEKAVHREVYEETGLKGNIIRKGEIYEYDGFDVRFVIHAFLFEPNNKDVVLSHEHTEHAWIDFGDYPKFDCMEEIVLDFKALGLI